MKEKCKKFLTALGLGGLLFALLWLPKVSMQGVRDGLSLWADAVLPALLPFFVVTALLRESGTLDVLSPLLRPLCALVRLPGHAGGLLLASWISGAPNGARLIQKEMEENRISAPEAVRFLSMGTLTSPLFLIGTVGLYLGSAGLGALIYGIHLLCAICNGLLWRGYKREVPLSVCARARARQPVFRAFPDALRDSSLSVLFVGGTIAFFSAMLALLNAVGVTGALSGILQFVLPTDAVEPLVAGFLEISTGARLTALCALSLPVRVSMLCALASFGGLSVLFQSQVFLGSAVSVPLYLCQRCTHALLSFFVCRAAFLFFGSAIPAFALSAPAFVPMDLHPLALPVLAACLLFSLIPWPKAVLTPSRRKGQ